MSQKRWARIAIAGAIALTAVSAIGSYSRGALLALAAMAFMLWLKGRHKVLLGTIFTVAALGLAAFMPSGWEERMGTIKQYQDDSSAMSRIETWKMLFNLAQDRPLVGGGFELYSQSVFDTYNPGYGGMHSAHSIYFQVLGEHGFIALGLFLLFWALVWRMCSQVALISKGKVDLRWAYWLAEMIKVSLIAYLVGGAFLNLAYWDMPYFLFVAIAVTRWIVVRVKVPAKGSGPASQSLPNAVTSAQVPIQRNSA